MPTCSRCLQKAPRLHLKPKSSYSEFSFCTKFSFFLLIE